MLFVSDAGDGFDSSRLAIHVLAECPAARASLPPRGGSEANRLLAQAYGVASRVEVRPSSGLAAPGNAIVVDASVTSHAALASHLGADPTGDGAAASIDGLLAGKRVVVVTNIPIHYRIELFNRVALRLRQVGASLHVLFTGGVPADRPWIDPLDMSFDFTYLSSIDLTGGRARRAFPRRLTRQLSLTDPDLVVSAGFSPLVSGRIARWCGKRGIRWGVWSGEVATRSTARGALRRLQRQRLARAADFGIAYGWESARYLGRLDRSLPVAILRSTAAFPPPRTEKGAEQAVVELLVVSRAEKGKALDLVVGAVMRLEGAPVRLRVIGDGPELAALREQAAGCRRIEFLGALPHARVTPFYTAADVFLFPSRYDVFGLVLVEAMAAGLAVITSDAPGAVSDLAVDETNCIVIREPTADAWHRAISRVARDPSLRERLGNRARDDVRSRWTLDHSAEAMICGLRLGVLANGGGSSE